MFIVDDRSAGAPYFRGTQSATGGNHFDDFLTRRTFYGDQH